MFMLYFMSCCYRLLLGIHGVISYILLCAEKDSVRTDRHMDYFNGDENIGALKRILGTFALYDPQLGTIQCTHCVYHHQCPVF